MALTRFPAHGGEHEQGATWFYRFGRDPALFYHEVAKLMADEEERTPGVGLYMAEDTRERLEPLIAKSERQLKERQKNSQKTTPTTEIPTRAQSDGEKPLSSGTAAALPGPEDDNSSALWTSSASTPLADFLDPNTTMATPNQSDPMQGVTPTPAAAAAPVAQQQQQQQQQEPRQSKYDKFFTKFGKWNEKTWPNPDVNATPGMSGEHLIEAAQLQSEYQEAVKGALIDEVPDQLADAKQLLRNYFKAVGDHVAEVNKKKYDTRPALREKELAAIHNPLQNLDYAIRYCQTPDVPFKKKTTHPNLRLILPLAC